MKKLLLTFCLSIIITAYSIGQTGPKTPAFSFSFSNGISKQNDKSDYRIAYVNAIRFQLLLQESPKLSSIFGFEYGQNGKFIHWVCEANWNYCQTLGQPPIEVISRDKLHYLSLFAHVKYDIVNRFYLRGGLSVDFPFMTSYKSNYESSDGSKSKNRERDFFGRKSIFNTSLGGSLIFGKTISINEKWSSFFELEYKMYNLIAVRFEDYEYYFLGKNQNPWVLGLNLGITI